MPLKNVTFADWMLSHARKKSHQERWLRELYPWPVLAQVEVDQAHVDVRQRILHDDVEYIVTLSSICWQPDHGTYKYRLLIESEGLGWHSRAFADEFDMCGAPDGTFATLFHTGKKEPLEKLARAFFAGRWTSIRSEAFETLAVSRFLGASVAGLVAEAAFVGKPLTHYPYSRIGGGGAPMFSSGRELWIGYRFCAEDAYGWARRSAAQASRVIAIYFAEAKHQIKTDLPANTEVRSVAELDASVLDGRYADQIRVLLRGNQLPGDSHSPDQLEAIVRGETMAPVAPITEADVTEALAALKRPCESKAELRYQLAAAVVINGWIEGERRLGFSTRKKFYAFKAKVGTIARWAATTHQPGVAVWADTMGQSVRPILYVRVDGVDFSFHEIPEAGQLLGSTNERLTWSGVRLKPIAPLVLAWARAFLPTRV